MLCKYFATDAVCAVLVWISAVCVIWAFMSPVKNGEESTLAARSRFVRHALSDPFLWVAIVLLVYAAVTALNSGVALAYDAELKLWKLSPPPAPMLPGGVEGSGGIYFAAFLLVLTLYPAVVHSLDSRQAVYFALTASIVAVIDAVFASASGIGIPSGSAVAYGLWTLLAAAAMFSAERSRRRPKELISALALAGCLAALLFAGRPIVACVFAAAVLLLALVFVGFTFRTLGALGIVRALLLLIVAASIAAALFHWRSGDWASLIPVWRGDAEPVLDRFAVAAWKSRPWTGTGVGSFPMVAKIAATAEDWMTLGAMPDFYANGWRTLLVERGMIGVLAVALAFGAMFFNWFRYARQRGLEKFAAAVPLLPLALAAVSVVMVFDSSAMQAEAIVAFAALAAVSVNGGQ